MDCRSRGVEPSMNELDMASWFIYVYIYKYIHTHTHIWITVTVCIPGWRRERTGDALEVVARENRELWNYWEHSGIPIRWFQIISKPPKKTFFLGHQWCGWNLVLVFFFFFFFRSSLGFFLAAKCQSKDLCSSLGQLILLFFFGVPRQILFSPFVLFDRLLHLMLRGELMGIHAYLIRFRFPCRKWQRCRKIQMFGRIYIHMFDFRIICTKFLEYIIR